MQKTYIHQIFFFPNCFWLSFKVEGEKVALAQTLRESQTSVERCQSDVQTLRGKLVKLAANIDSLHHLAHHLSPANVSIFLTLSK